MRICGWSSDVCSSDLAETAGRAKRDQTSATIVLVNDLGQRREETATGRGERMARSEAATLDVHLGAINRTERRIEAELVLAERRIFPGLQRAQHQIGRASCRERVCQYV